MKPRFFAGLVLASFVFASCDTTTDSLGISITDTADNLTIKTDTFTVTTRSLKANAVLSRTTTAYLGKVRDPETGAYITGDCMIQFHNLENYEFPKKESIQSLKDGEVIADSVEIRLYYNNFYGDSLEAMKMSVHELDKPLVDGNYYTDYDIDEMGYLRKNGLTAELPYTLADLNVSESLRGKSSYRKNIRINLDKPYTDKEGNSYNNFGTYIMRTYYKTPSYFKNAYTFIQNVVPGFYFKTESGLNSMAYISASQLNVYFRYNYKDSVYTGIASFAGTEEVLQTTHFTNDNHVIDQLVADNTCSYLKSPAGIFTEMTLPIDEIVRGHENDSINSAKIVLNRINNSVNDEYSLNAPSTILMIPKAQLQSFFESNSLPDYKSSFLATYTSSTNTYTFNNISGMISYMDKHRTGDDWNKAVLIPVNAAYTTVNSSTILTSVTHDMSLTSTKLVGGLNNPGSPIKIGIIYSKFK
ncbi:protein of unknown function [Prevotella sp. KH2C16]|nr:DUF4270 domain-containing protein [Prevotella sp. KH2C16]SFG12346.1 protein of unknown function [Prevotella sp. KH2C16]